MARMSVSADIHLTGNVAKYGESQDRLHTWISLAETTYPTVSLHCDREALESIAAAVRTALLELDIREGKAKAGDEGVCDLGREPVSQRQERCDGCSKELVFGEDVATYNHTILCLDCDAKKDYVPHR